MLNRHKALATTLLCLCATSVLAAERPNILFLFTDDQAYDTLGVYGNPDVKTPNIDSLGERGVVFDRHYDTTAICMASRVNVMTGLYEYKSGCNFDHGDLTSDKWAKSWPVLLGKSGYRTGFGGKFGFKVAAPNDKKAKGKEGDRAQHDFDFYVGWHGQTSYNTAKMPYLKKYADKYPHSSRAYGAATIDFMRESVQLETPFCMAVFYKAPHRPVQPDPMFDDIYPETTFRKLPNYGREAGLHFSKHSQLGRQYERFVSWGYSKEETYQQALRKYNQLIHGVDYSIGMILKELKSLEVEDNTVIIFSSDNGYFNGSHGLGSKVLPYEEGARVPLIIYDPRHQKSGTMRRTEALTGNVDIAATILDLAGIKIPSNYDGKSLLPIVADTKTSVRKTLPIIQVWGPEPTRCLSVLSERYKYIYWYYQDERQGLQPTEELYDLSTDPYELQNVATNSAYADALNEMRLVYDKQVKHWRDEGVDFNGYENYGTLFDRHTGWDQKARLFKKQR